MKNLLTNKYVTIGLLVLVVIMAIALLNDSPDAGEVHSEADHIGTEWTCSMHPQIRQPDPGKCPICGMDLIPVSEDGAEDELTVSLSDNAMKLANVVTTIVGSGSETGSININGRIEADETKQFVQSAHIPGRIEQLNVNFEGEMIRSGQRVGTIYSPDLLTAQRELIEASKIKDQQPALYEAAVQKLRNWKLSQGQINAILQGGEPIQRFPILADVSGYVEEKLVNIGDYVKRGEGLYKVSNLSTVWVMFDLYENQLPNVGTGDQVTFTVPSLPGKELTGEISYIDPVVDRQTRVAQARVALPNSEGMLKPGMLAYGKLELTGKASGQITVPKSAIMWTGERSLVYMKEANGFRLREVTLGAMRGDHYIIEEGLNSGDEIAVSGTFSIDAAAQLAGKPSMMNVESMDRLPRPTVVEARDIYEPTAAFKNQLKHVYQAYLPVKDALVQSNIAQAKTASKQAQKVLQEVNMGLLDQKPHMEWMRDLKVLESSLMSIAEASSVEQARTALYPLSDQLYHSLKKFSVEVGGYRQYCPMAFDNEGAYWLSDTDEIRNPYFGDMMLTCGNVEEEL